MCPPPLRVCRVELLVLSSSSAAPAGHMRAVASFMSFELSTGAAAAEAVCCCCYFATHACSTCTTALC